MNTSLLQWWPIKSKFKPLSVLALYSSGGSHVMETGFPSGGTPVLTGAVTRHLPFVSFDALQVDKRTAEGGGGEVRVGDACRGRGKEGASQIFGYSCLQAVR